MNSNEGKAKKAINKNAHTRVDSDSEENEKEAPILRTKINKNARKTSSENRKSVDEESNQDEEKKEKNTKKKATKKERKKQNTKNKPTPYRNNSDDEEGSEKEKEKEKDSKYAHKKKNNGEQDEDEEETKIDALAHQYKASSKKLLPEFTPNNIAIFKYFSTQAKKYSQSSELIWETCKKAIEQHGSVGVLSIKIEKANLIENPEKYKLLLLTTCVMLALNETPEKSTLIKEFLTKKVEDDRNPYQFLKGADARIMNVDVKNYVIEKIKILIPSLIYWFSNPKSQTPKMPEDTYEFIYKKWSITLANVIQDICNFLKIKITLYNFEQLASPSDAQAEDISQLIIGGDRAHLAMSSAYYSNRRHKHMNINFFFSKSQYTTALDTFHFKQIRSDEDTSKIESMLNGKLESRYLCERTFSYANYRAEKKNSQLFQPIQRVGSLMDLPQPIQYVSSLMDLPQPIQRVSSIMDAPRLVHFVSSRIQNVALTRPLQNVSSVMDLPQNLELPLPGANLMFRSVEPRLPILPTNISNQLSSAKRNI